MYSISVSDVVAGRNRYYILRDGIAIAWFLDYDDATLFLTFKNGG